MQSVTESTELPEEIKADLETNELTIDGGFHSPDSSM